MAGYDTVAVNIDGGEGKQKDYKFLISADRKTLLRVTKFDLTKDPYADLMSKIDVRLNQLFRTSLDGIPLDLASRVRRLVGADDRLG